MCIRDRSQGRRDELVSDPVPNISRVARVLLLLPVVSVRHRRMQVRRGEDAVLGTSRRRNMLLYSLPNRLHSNSFAPRVHLHVLLAVPKPLVGQEDHEGGVAATGGGTHPQAQQGAGLGENALWPHRAIHARRATDSLTLP